MKKRAIFLKAKEAIDDLFGDTSVPRSQTKDELEELFADIEGMLDSLNDDAGEEPR